MHNKSHNIRILILFAFILSATIFCPNVALAQSSSDAYSGGGVYATCGEISPGFGSCLGEEHGGVHWIKMSIDTFRNIYGGIHDRNYSYERTAINTCMDKSKNKSNWIVSAGYYGYQSDRNIDWLYLFNPTQIGFQMRNKANHDKSHSVNDNGEPYGGNIFSDNEVQGVFDYLISNGRNETDLAVFCPTMAEQEVKSAATFESQTRSNINGNAWSSWNSNSQDYYINSHDDNNISVTFNFQHNLKTDLDRTGKTPLKPWWQINRNGSLSGVVGIGNKTVGTNFSPVESLNSPSVDYSTHLGTSETICQTITHPANASIVDIHYGNAYVHNKSINYTGANYSSAGNSNSSSCATTRHPYDFTTSVSTNPIGNTLYIGESRDVNGSVKNSGTHDDNSATPHTITPSDTNSRLIQFTVNADVAADDTKLSGGITSSDPCEFFRSKLGAGNTTCNGNLKSETTSITNGDTKNLSGTINVPDDASFLGKKICVATAVSYADSGNGYNGGLNKKWRVSGASCNTVAKKPNIQVWGGVSTRGSINTAYSSKSGRTYGSWAEHLVVAGGVVNRFGSGASLGYATGSYNLSLPGGKNGTNPNTKDISLLTVSNSGNAIGKSNITTSSQLIESLKTRFSGESAGVEFTNSAAEFDGKIERLFGTKVYKIDGDVTIKNDICYGNCNGSPTKLESYNLSSNQPATIPQIIIFAKNIKINENVKRIDAWLISDNDIDTCNGHAIGNNNLSSSSCKETLVINGPVFAKSIQLKRTAGAESGDGIQEAGNVLTQDISNDGSIAPAEVFNLRGDAYIWSHIQAKRSNEAVTVYTRELAPRL